MLLDQFTPEQIEQIKVELDFREKSSAKDTTVSNSFSEIRELYKYDVVKYWEIGEVMYKLCDIITHNYLFRRDKNGAVLRRNVAVIVPSVNPEEYRQVYSEITEIIKKHYKGVRASDALAASIEFSVEDVRKERLIEFGDGVLPISAYNILCRAGIRTQEQLLSMSENEIASLRGCGRARLTSILQYIESIRMKEAN